MTNYIIIELPDGLEPVELPHGRTATDVAQEEGGVLVDEGPFATLADAEDAIENLKPGTDDEA